MLFHTSMQFRRWIAKRKWICGYSGFYYCPHCDRPIRYHLDLLSFYRDETPTQEQLGSMLHLSRTTLLCRSYQNAFAECFSGYKRAIDLYDLAGLALKCPVTPETINLIRLCLIGLKGTALRKLDLCPFVSWRASWDRFRELASKKSEWESLVYGRTSYEVYQALKEGTWTRKTIKGRQKRDYSPKRSRPVRRKPNLEVNVLPVY